MEFWVLINSASDDPEHMACRLSPANRSGPSFRCVQWMPPHQDAGQALRVWLDMQKLSVDLNRDSNRRRIYGVLFWYSGRFAPVF